jgi:predicted ATPase
MLSELGFNEGIADDDAVAILVGPNGSGKSIHLRNIALEYRWTRRVTVLSNTADARFNGLRTINRYSVGRSGKSPKTIIKTAVAGTLDRETSDFYHISAILEYCGYLPRFGFRLDGFHPGRLDILENISDSINGAAFSEQQHKDLVDAKHFFKIWPHEKIMWVDSSGPVYDFSVRRQFAAILRLEAILIRARVIRGVRVYLKKRTEDEFELQNASSGEISLISSLVFLATTVEENSIVLIDEPENSLHPSWQREYVSNIFAALAYRNVSIIIATHSPLIVTGAIIAHPNFVSVYQMSNGHPRRLSLDGAITNDTGIEAVLWKAFDVVTPANHFISEEIVDAINLFERGMIEKNTVKDLVETMSKKSFDPKQGDFFEAILTLLDKVEIRKKNGESDRRPKSE